MSAAPVTSPPMWSCQAMDGTAKLMARLRTIRNMIPRLSSRSRLDSTNHAPNRPKMAPEAPSADWFGGAK